MANYIFVARADGVFEIGEIEVGSRWVVGVVFVVGGDHLDDDDNDDDARSLGRVFVAFNPEVVVVFSSSFCFRAPAPNE